MSSSFRNLTLLHQLISSTIHGNNLFKLCNINEYGGDFLMKISRSLLYFLIPLFMFIQVPFSKAKSEVLNNSSSVNQGSYLSDDTIRSLIYPYITDSINKYYGGNGPQFELSKAKLSINQPDPEIFSFIVTAQVITFVGPHNPPYGIETVTIETSPTGTKVINFKHEDEKLPTR